MKMLLFKRAGFAHLSIVAASLLPVAALANRPLLQTPTAIKNIRMAMPIPFDTALRKDLLGLDQEDQALRETTMKQAAEYVDLRRGKLKSIKSMEWYAKCQAEALEGKMEANPYCAYEIDRRLAFLMHTKTSHRIETRELANEIKNGHYDKAVTHTYGEMITAASQLDSMGAIDDAAQKIANLATCVPSSVSSALAYHLEERFPDEAAVNMAKKLYRKSSECGTDAASAQASFRLGLIHIWQHDCSEIPDLMKKVEGISDASQYHARAKYWRYYCASQAGDEVAKSSAKDQLLRQHPMSFQALAVSGDDDAAIGQMVGDDSSSVALRSLVRPDINGVIRGSEALVRLGANSLAAEIIDRNVKEIGTIEPEVRMYLAVLLTRIGYSLPKFKILAELFQDAPETLNLSALRLFFPLSYYDTVRLSSGGKKVDPLLILSLIRQESAFNKDARSSVGARGLMQVMPQTARTIASVRSTKRLLDPEINIGVGTKYFSKRLESNGGDVELTLAAYNAGFGRVEQWKKRYPTDNKLLFLDMIPFRETRDYVSAILRNYYWYTKLYTAQDGTSTIAPPLAPIEAARVIEGKLSAPTLGHTLGNKVLAIMSANAGMAAAASMIHADIRTVHEISEAK